MHNFPMTPKTLQPNAHLNTNRLFNASANQIISLAHNLTRLPNMFARAPPSPIQHNGNQYLGTQTKHTLTLIVLNSKQLQFYCVQLT